MRLHLSYCPTPPRRGGVTPLTVLSLALLVGVVAIAVDGGTLMEERRHVQATADAAALAAAADLYTNYAANQGADPKGTAQASALATASANGLSNDGVQSVVTVSVSPQTYQGGPNAGQALPAGYVEVIIQYNAGRTFSNVFGTGTIPVRARAVARGQWMPDNNAVMVLNLTASGALTISGSAGLKVNGGLLVNSKSSTGISVSLFGSLSALVYNLNQAVQGLLGLLLSLLGGLGGGSPTVNYNPPIADPLRYLPDPDPIQLGLATRGTNLQVNGGGSVDLYPGVYTGGITVSGGSTAILHANADGTPGIYFLQGGGFNVSASSVQMAAGETGGVMIYNDWSSNTSDLITVNGSGTVNINPPRSGVYLGLSIFQKRGSRLSAAPPVTLSGSGALDIRGTLYAAYAKVNLSGSSSADVLGGQIIADTLNISGGAVINVDRGTQPTANTRTLGLVE
jgi:Flp pilus assembly protein TadG